MNIDILKNSEWSVVKLKRTNLWNWNKDVNYGDFAHYESIVKWCEKTYTQGTWKSKYLPNFGKIDSYTKEFGFKCSRDRTLFLLKWA